MRRTVFVTMIYRENYSVRWHDTDATGAVSPGGMLLFMQETANRQFEAAGRSLDRLHEEKGLAFMLSRMAFDLLLPVHAYENITVETFTCESRGVLFRRGFRVLRGEELVARGASHWALVRLCDRSLVSVTESPCAAFGDEPEEKTTLPLRFRVGADLQFAPVGVRRVSYADIDFNLHMNNTKYPNMLCDFLPDPTHTVVRGMSLFYCREAAYGDAVTVERADGGDGVYYFRTKKGETTCLEALVQTERKE